MRKLIITAIFLALALGADQAYAKRVAAPQAARDAASRSSESVMTSNVTQAMTNIPVGTIIAWPHFGGLPNDAENWAECNGQAVPASSDLYKMGVTVTPNLYAGQGTSGRGYFLRAGATPRQTAADQFESHLHGQPEHTHLWDGQLASTAVYTQLDDRKVETKLDSDEVSGTAEGQRYKYREIGLGNSSMAAAFRGNSSLDAANATGLGAGGMTESSNMQEVLTDVGVGISVSGEGVSGYSAWTQDYKRDFNEWRYMMYMKAQDSDVTAKVENVDATGEILNGDTHGNVTNGTVIGTVHASGGDNTYETGGDETAPTYYSTRYFMRINQ